MKRRRFLKTLGGVAGGAVLTGAEAPPVAPPVAQPTSPPVDPTDGTGMPRRELGRTGIRISVVGFSGFALTRDSQEVCTRAVRDALARGVNYLDVAPAYGDGDCEKKLGKALEGVDRKSYFLASKSKKRDREGIRLELERSLERLKTDHFDVYQLHHLVRPEEVKQALGPGGAMETIRDAKEKGKIRAIGFSAHTTKAALEALRSFPFDTVMFPINYVEYFTRDYGKEVLALAKEKGAAVLAIKPMNSGAWPEGVERKRAWWYRSLEEQADIDLAFRFTLSLPAVVTGFPPAWLDLQAKAIEAGRALRPLDPADEEKLRKMAQDCGSIFKREEDSVAKGWPHRSPYPHSPHEACSGEWA